MTLSLQTPAELTRGLADPLLYDTADLCRLLNCSPATLFRRKSAGLLLRGIRWGGKLCWRAEEVKEWVKAGMPPAKEWEARQKASR